MSRRAVHVVGDVMRRPVVTVARTTSIADALALLRTERVRHLVVVDAGAVCGVVSERDLTHAQPSLTARWLVHDVMSASPVVVAPSTSIAEAAHVLRSRRIGCLPVVRGGALVGVVTRGDLLGVLEHGDVPVAPPVRCIRPMHARRSGGAA